MRIVISSIIAAAACWWQIACASPAGRLADIAPTDGRSIRDFVLHETRADLHDSSHRFDYVWSVVLETGYEDGAVTIVAFADGTSLITTTLRKDGYHGAGHPAAISESARAVELAVDHPRWFRRSEDGAPPAAGEVRMFAVGAWGLRAAPTFRLSEVSQRNHPYYALWATLHDLGQILKVEPTL